MHVTKLRVSTDQSGLVPAGRYFARVASALRVANKFRGADVVGGIKTHRRAKTRAGTEITLLV